MELEFDQLPETFLDLHLCCGNCGCFISTHFRDKCYGLYNLSGLIKACDCTKLKTPEIIIKVDLSESEEEPYETISSGSSSNSSPRINIPPWPQDW